MYGFSITWQLRTDKTTLKAGSERVRNAWLKTKVAHKMTTQHERDAVTHALVYLKRKRHLPTLKEYWGVTMCDKRKFLSKRSARLANRQNGKSLRVYYHLDCGYYHVTKQRDANY
jgi:hypothetical protein